MIAGLRRGAARSYQRHADSRWPHGVLRWFQVQLAMVAVAGTLLPFSALGADSTDKSGVSPSRLKLPKGPGSLEGIGENAEPNLSMGLATYGIEIQLPAGYEQATPSLQLSYNSGSGNSEVGVGWSLGLPSIERMTSKGLPRYTTQDLFAADGSDELVRVDDTRGVYRARFERGFVRYTWVDSEKAGKAGYWKAEFPDGRVGYFGADSTGTVEPNARVEGPNGTFRYHLVDVVDPLGHLLRYEYTKDGSCSLLERIAYVFQTGADRDPRFQVLLTYESRPDQLSDAKPGFDVRLGHRLTGIQVLSRGVQLRRYALTYRQENDRTYLSRLERVRHFGINDVGPHPIEFHFDYTGENTLPCSGSGCDSPVTVRVTGSLGLDFNEHKADLIDINGDGLPDVLDTSQPKHQFFANRLDQNGTPTFSSASPSINGSMTLDEPSVQTVDLDGDGFTDLVSTNAGNGSARVLWNKGQGDWASDLTVSNLGLPDFAQAQNLRFLDYNNDKKIDLLFNDGQSAYVYENQGNNQFAANTSVDPLGVSFESLDLADMNGDGLLDAVQITSDQFQYRLNLGWGKWSDWIVMQDCPRRQPGEVHLTDLNGDGLSDPVVALNDTNKVQYWLNHDGHGCGTLVEADVAGAAIPLGSSLRFADMNGNGTVDVVWITPSGAVTYLEIFPTRPNLIWRITNGAGRVIELSYGSAALQMAAASLAGKPWSYRLPTPSTLLESIAIYDTLSKVRQTRHFEYRDGYYDGAEKQFRGYERVTVASDGDANVEQGITVHDFDVGRTDVYKKALLKKQGVYSVGSAGKRELHELSNSYTDCAVGGIDGTSTSTSSPHAAVRFICQTEARRLIEEGAASEDWITTREAYAYDAYGNRTKTMKEGVIGTGPDGSRGCADSSRGTDVFGAPIGANCLGDESIEQTDFVPPTATNGRWMLNKPARKRVYGRDNGAVYAETINHYDGDPFAGLPSGQLTTGLLTRIEARVDANTLIDTQASQFDANGNPVEVHDPNGHARRFTYDDAGILPLSEEIALSGHSQPYSLLMTASYDSVRDTIIELSSWMRVEGGAVKSSPRSTYYSYDEFSRLTAMARPGDSRDSPTETYEYDVRDPISRVIRRARTKSGGATDFEEVLCFDGLGRKFEVRSRIDSSKFQVSGYTTFDAQGNERDTYQSFIGTDANCDSTPPSGVLATHTRYDAAQRAIAVTHPDSDIYGTASVTTTAFAPLQTTVKDAEDNDPASSHSSTPEVTTFDGLGRTTGIDRYIAADKPVHLEITYDELGHLRGYVDAARNQKVQTYDALGRLLQVEDPDSHTTKFAYDNAGNVVKEVDARNVTTRSRYDEANRLVEVWQDGHEDTTRIDYAYDVYPGCTHCTNLEGLLARVTYPMSADRKSVGEDAIGYDPRGQAVYSRRTFGDHVFEVTTEFDNLGRIVARNYPTGTRISRNLDRLGRLTEVPGYIPSITYDARGLPSVMTLGNGVVTAHTYDSLARLKTLNTIRPTGASLQAYAYERDRVGNILSITDGVDTGDTPSANARYEYDNWYRLTAAHLDESRKSEEHLTYQYDELDNILSKVSNAGSNSPEHVGAYTYGENGAGPHAATTAGDMKLQYDPAGNMSLHGQDTYNWDFMGRLQSAQRGNASLGTYTYGATRERVKKEEDGHVTYYVAPDFEVRDGTAIVYVTIGDSRVVQLEFPEYAVEFVGDAAPGTTVGSDFAPTPDGKITAGDGWVAHEFMGGQAGTSSDPPASVVQALCSSARREIWADDAAIVYIHHDHLKSTTGLTDESGISFYSAGLFPHGSVRYQTSQPVIPYSFTGKEWDESSTLHYFGSRFFDSRLSQWTALDVLHQRWRWPSPQPRAGQSPSNDVFEAINRYQYVSGNPIAKTDPDGTKYQLDPSCSADFKRQFRIAIRYLNKHQASGIIAAVEKRPEVVIIREGNAAMGDRRAEYSSNGTTRTITIDFHSALLTTSGGKQSPALLFVHESAHALHDIKNPGQWLVDINTPTLTPQDIDYDNVEERKTIKGAETRAARRLGEDIRTDHRGTFYHVARSNRR